MAHSNPASARAARVNADEAKRRLDTTLTLLKARLEPAALQQDASHFAREQARAVARQSREQLRRRPAILIGIAGAVAVALLQRPLRSYLAKRRRARDRAAVKGVTIQPPRPGGTHMKGTQA